jgi:hypothetical protein
MAKLSAEPNYEIDWILRDRKVIDGLDHLGIELVSVNLYQAMLPGLTNVTERARYYSFYPWTIHRYAQEGPPKRTKADWRNWFRALDFTYAVACMAYEKERGEDIASSVVGAELASRLINETPLTAKIDLQGPSAVQETGSVPQSGAYFKNPEGGFGQYYKGPLRELGIVVQHELSAWPAVKLSNYAGKKVAESLDENKAFDDLKALAIEGRARLNDLSRIGKLIHPSAIPADSREATILRQLMFGDDEDLCQGELTDRLRWRRASLLLMLHFLQEAEGMKDSLAYEFRWACMAGCLPDGRIWHVPDSLLTSASAWGAYQRNDLLNYSLECLFYSALLELDRRPQRPTKLANHLADLAMAAVAASTEYPALPALPDKVATWINANRLPKVGADADPWGPLSTRALADRLEIAVADREMTIIPTLAARVLARLATDRSDSTAHPFAAIPQAVEMASSHEVHLRRWWKRVESASHENTSEFLQNLLLEWVIYRHLRVAMRKLASQGVSTFKYRPEGGKLILVVERLPDPTYTAPRVRQGFRIMEDLHFVRRVDDRVEISDIGKSTLARHLA